MGSFPFGPHGPETRPYDPTPNPTAQTTFPNIGGGDVYAPASAAPFPGAGYSGPTTGGGVGYGGTASGGGGPLLSLTLSLLMLPFVWMFYMCLYPLTTAAGLVGGVVVATLSARSLQPDEGAVAGGFGILAGYAVMVVMSRVEYKLAQNTGFRLVRHLVRLTLLGALAIPWIQTILSGTFMSGAGNRYILAVMTHPLFLLQMMFTRQGMVIVGSVMAGMHFLLWKSGGLSAFWHRRLMWLGLK